MRTKSLRMTLKSCNL